MKMAKAPQEHVDRLRIWMQFTDELSKIDPTDNRMWNKFKEDCDNEDFDPIIKHSEDMDGFKWDFYMDYFQRNISHIYMRIVFGYEILVDNVCDPDLNYLEFKPEIKELLPN
jgi:hypothetical protein